MENPNETTPISIRLPRERLRELQAIARRHAAVMDRRYTLSDLVRDALEAYPPTSMQCPTSNSA